jgi:hypothetical protein
MIRQYFEDSEGCSTAVSNALGNQHPSFLLVSRCSISFASHLTIFAVEITRVISRATATTSHPRQQCPQAKHAGQLILPLLELLVYRKIGDLRLVCSYCPRVCGYQPHT